MQEFFRKFANRVALLIGSAWTFLIVLAAIAASGYYFNFSDDWKLNVAHAVAVASLLVLIILQSSQNHNDKATHLKLDELIKAHEGARDEVASVEKKADKHLEDLRD